MIPTLFQNYLDECQWLADKGVLDGEGFYPGMGADVFPLMAKEKGHLTSMGISWTDPYFGLGFLSMMDIDPNEVYGSRVGVNPDNPKVEEWDNFTHVMSYLGDTLPDFIDGQTYDFVIVKGFNQYMCCNRSEKTLERLQLVHDRVTKPGTRMIVQGNPGIFESDNRVAGSFLQDLGYRAMDEEDGFLDARIKEIRGAYTSSGSDTIPTFVSDIVEPGERRIIDPTRFMISVEYAGHFHVYERME